MRSALHFLPRETTKRLHTGHRPDIDGLRALAVLAVVACHLNVRGAAGGFVGVDVFFVISGYLVGGNLLREISSTKSINLYLFYARRIRRILPALLFLLFALGVYGYLRLLPRDVIELFQSILATLLLFSNIHFEHLDGYFGPHTATNFLTNMWSLSIEEQFYIALPPALLLSGRYLTESGIKYVLAVVAATSLTTSIVWTAYHPGSAFYLLPARGWELLLGTLTCIYQPRLIGLCSPLKETLLSWTGVVMILGAVVIYDKTTWFPGVAVLIPCIGTCLILATRAGLVHQILSMRGAVFIGRISYSLYLWHWPLIVVRWHDRLMPMGRWERLSFVAVLVTVACISWKWIETPFRQRRRISSQSAVYATSGAISFLLITGCVVALHTQGASYRYTPREQRLAAALEYGGTRETFRVGRCFLEESNSFVLAPECISVDPDKKNVLLLGSSYLAQLHEAFSLLFPETNFLQITAPGCSVRVLDLKLAGTVCPEIMHYAFDEYLPHHHVDAIILQVGSSEIRSPIFAKTLRGLRQQGIGAYVVGEQVSYNRTGPELAIEHLRQPGRNLDAYLISSRKDDEELRRISREAGGVYLSMFDALCGNGPCELLAAPDTPMQVDQVHLSKSGSLQVVDYWRGALFCRNQGNPCQSF